MIVLSLLFLNLLLNNDNFKFLHYLYYFLMVLSLNILFMFFGYKVIFNYSEDIYRIFFFPLLSSEFSLFPWDQVCLFGSFFFILLIFFKYLVIHCYPFRVKNWGVERLTEGSEYRGID